MTNELHILEEALECIARLKRDGAKVHSITNTVTQGFTANVLLACGATPSMTVNPDEIEYFTANANAVHINLGTLDTVRIEAITKAVTIATKRKLPIVLDPVMAHISPLRRDFAKSLISGHSPTVKANAEEADALELDAYGQSYSIITGAVDRIVFPGGDITIENGDPALARLIGTGCALGAVIAALSARSANVEPACLAGLAWFSIAGELAAENSDGPGSFHPAFLDALHKLKCDEIQQRLILNVTSTSEQK